MRKPGFFAVLSLLAMYLALSAGEPAPAMAEGFELHKVIAGKNLHSFAWDERGAFWTLGAKGNRLFVENTGAPALSHSFRRRGNHPAGLLINAGRIFVSDADAIRVFQRNENRWAEKPPLVLPRVFFPLGTRISSLRWSPLGHLHFSFHSSAGQPESGIGRFDLRKNEWDILAKGIDGGHFSFDQHGLMIASDTSSDLVFRVASGLDYAQGLENHTKADVALRADKAGLKPTGMAVYAGDQWPDENQATWLLFDRQTSSLQQYREEENQLKYWRDLARWNSPIAGSQLQTGPDGALWFLAGDSILRLEARATSPRSPTLDLTALTTPEVVAHLHNANSWQRDTALRVLESREELRATRGLHPSTALHKLWSEKTTAPLTRAHVLLALHRTGLLDEGALENAAEEPDPLGRLWAARLFGERKYPTEAAFDKLEKMARDTNSLVRNAVAVAARQFVSGSLIRDTPPPLMPIREVFTGGILSSLWFSTEKGSSPEFDLLYWNAVKPITAFDPAHPLGFFHGDREEGMALAYWIITRITRQVAETDDPLKQEDAMQMLTQLKPANHRMLHCALEGLKAGASNRKVIPTEKSLAVLRQFAQSQDQNVGKLVGEILAAWSEPLPKR